MTLYEQSTNLSQSRSGFQPLGSVRKRLEARLALYESGWKRAWLCIKAAGSALLLSSKPLKFVPFGHGTLRIDPYYEYTDFPFFASAGVLIECGIQLGADL